ncbi:hypothetical protein MRX96_040931 [Rhipicephalus microplus]
MKFVLSLIPSFFSDYSTGIYLAAPYVFFAFCRGDDRVGAKLTTHSAKEAECDAPRLVHCSNKVATLARDHGLVLHALVPVNPVGCIEWLPTQLCVAQKGFREGGGYRFSTREECSTLCERGMPRRECVQPLPLTAVYNCTHAASQSQQQWWFYDIVSHACREWEHACIYKSYATMAHCVRDCLPEPWPSS